MRIVADISPKEAFARYAAISRELREKLRDEADRTKFLDHQKERRENDERQLEEQQFESFVQMVVLATEPQIAAFAVKLDRYDAATVEALMQNEQEIREVRERIETMLKQAHQLPDGRRVFKSLDGKRVFDENGHEVSAEEVQPGQISDAQPRFEPYWEERKHEKVLVQERDDLHDFQRKLDAARDETDRPDLTKDELDALEKDIDDATPQRVRALAGDDLDIHADATALDEPSAAQRSGAGIDDASLDTLDVIDRPSRNGPTLGPS